MRAWVLLLSGVVAGCGGAVDGDLFGSGGAGATGGSGGSGAVGGSGAAAGSGAASGSGGTAASGGSGGSGAIGGTGAVSGSGGAGGSAGAGGEPGCCTHDTDCPQWLAGSDDTGVPLSSACVNGVCKEIAPYPQCWRNEDCPSGQCQGAAVCPCGADCAMPDQPGVCVHAPPSPCCKTDWDCGDFMYVPCVSGMCKQPVPDGCWKDAECPNGQKCVGANVCPCGALCVGIDTPGKCQ